MIIFDWQHELNRKGHRVAISGQPIAMHCHHYNINLQKTLEDTLGDEGVQLLYQSAEETSYHGFQNLFNQYKKIRTIKSKLELAAMLYQNSGLGIIHFQRVRPSGARIESPASHHVTGWLAKHGRRDTPGCHFTRGWIAGTLEAIYSLPCGFYTVDETKCKMKRDDECIFHVQER
ncbi:MAG: 4-vinyl reductase [Deltaproteobacteria bacterium]|nr:MAG: 4-vinyl reductase [Deltaproteobacteria bacterium]